MIKRSLLPIGLILAPVFSFYGMLVQQTVNIPFLDDYSGVLGFLIRWTQLGSRHERWMSILDTQHNEYKLILADLIYALQYRLIGHVDFAALSAVGNLTVLPLFGVLYAMWMRDERAAAHRLALFVPVSWLLFQLQYYSLLSWPLSTLQNLPVVLFAFLAIYLLSLDRTLPFSISLVCLALAVGSSGNGFFVIPIGCVMLLQFGRFQRIGVWLLTSTLLLAVYFHRFNFQASQSLPNRSVGSRLLHISPLYALSFLGSTIANYNSYKAAAAFGVLLCAGACWACFDKLFQRNPAMFYSICFVLITALAVSGIRSDFGIAQSLASRYRIYSTLMIILLYLFGIDRAFDPESAGRSKRLWELRWWLFSAVAAVAIGFNLASDLAGYKLLRTRTQLTQEGLCRWQRGEQPAPLIIGDASNDPVIERQILHGIFVPEDAYLRDAMRLHLYTPPPACNQER